MLACLVVSANSILARPSPRIACGESTETSSVTFSSLSTVEPVMASALARFASVILTSMSRAWMAWPVVASMNENRPPSMRTSASSSPEIGRPASRSAAGGAGAAGMAGSNSQLGRPSASTSRKIAGSRTTRLSTTTERPISGNSASLMSTPATEIISGDGMPSAFDRRNSPMLIESGSTETLMSPSMRSSRPVASRTALAISGS